MFRGPVPFALFASLGILTTVVLGQPTPGDVRHVLSNREARKLVNFPEEATVPSGFSPTQFSVQVSVGKDGKVKNVSNPHKLPSPLFAAAKEAARQWRFDTDRDGGKLHAFVAEITFHGPIAGRVTTKDGSPVAGVVVSGSVWKCCPPERDRMTTDSSGSFRIEHPGTVLHFDPPDSFQPQSVVVTAEISTLNLTVAPASSGLSLAACTEPQPGLERVGEGRYGLQFDVPKKDVNLIRGKLDVDYVVHIVKAKNSDDSIEFWFGPYAMTPMPDDEQFVESETFTVRNVMMPPGLHGSDGGVIGGDVWGRMPDGKIWRQMAAGMEGALYQDVSPENAALFDRIINSACWIPWPEH
jgi:hypothetical protein